MKPLLVGESNPYGSDPSFALYHLPRGASGDRLREILGLTDAEYLDRFERVNLIEVDYWTLSHARECAQRLHARDVRQPFVLLGSKVADAFDYVIKGFPRVVWRYTLGHTPLPRRVLLMPHPSGRNRRWNEPELAEKCRALVAELTS